MKRTLVAVIVVCSLLCGSCTFLDNLANNISSIANLANCEYTLKDVSNVSVAGVNVKNVTSGNISATDVVKLEHQKTGSVLYWLANDNIDRSYMMAFNTPINNNTGMPHVFEHATLGGSGKYPGANTFFEMMAKTSYTYLNAQTAQYLTMYPMSATSEEQLLKFVDYYSSSSESCPKAVRLVIPALHTV